MKIYFLPIFASVALLFTSCEKSLEDEQVEKVEPIMVSKSNTKVTEWAWVYQEVFNSFKYDSTLDKSANLKNYYVHVKQVLQHYGYKVDDTPVDFGLVQQLQKADEIWIDAMDYSPQTKAIIKQLVMGKEYPIINKNNFTTEEYQLLTTLICFENRDDGWDKIRRIAFAYGMQQSLAHALFYTGAVQF